MPMPKSYPLPWCEKFDVPYYKINLALCIASKKWRARQTHKPMSEIIPWIDELIETGILERSN